MDFRQGLIANLDLETQGQKTNDKKLKHKPLRSGLHLQNRVLGYDIV